MTRRFAVLGDPVAHSKSPAMHAAAYRALGLDCTYEAIRATPADLALLVRSLREGGFDGFNVTIPHKRRILEHADRLDPSAESVGAATMVCTTATRPLFTGSPWATTAGAWGRDAASVATAWR